MRRQYRADVILAQNIRALLGSRGVDGKALAQWCGHRGAWLSKILNGTRGIRTVELGRIADFFGLTVSDLFQYGISHERRRHERRRPDDRRTGRDRRARHIGAIHPDVVPRFLKRPDDDSDSR